MCVCTWRVEQRKSVVVANKSNNNMNPEETPATMDVMQTYKSMSSPEGKEKRLRSSNAPPLPIKAAIDNMPSEYDPPLDYTFMNLECLQECLTQDPRTDKIIGTTPRKPSIEETEAEVNEKPKKKTNALRLSNNNLGEEIWDELEPICSKMVCDLSDIEWMDLSYNQLSTIDNRLPDLFPNCKVLYLHGNQLSKMTDIDKLSRMRHLRRVTLHGNPLAESTLGYRPLVISKLPPSLNTLDFSGVSGEDRMLAEYNPYPKRKKKKKKVADWKL